MELLLNLLWIVVATGVMGVILRHQCSRASRLPWATVLVIALFLAVLLFPVISASDDLYAQFFLTEDASRRMLSAVPPHPDSLPVAALLCYALFIAAWFELRYSGRVIKRGLRILLPSVARGASGLRAPPLSAIL